MSSTHDAKNAMKVCARNLHRSFVALDHSQMRNKGLRVHKLSPLKKHV